MNKAFQEFCSTEGQCKYFREFRNTSQTASGWQISLARLIMTMQAFEDLEIKLQGLRELCDHMSETVSVANGQCGRISRN